MEKDIDKITKNPDTDIVIRIDDFGGKRGVTIREFVKGERYTGFTKAGTRIPADKFKIFKQAINSIDEADLVIEEGEQSTLPSNSNNSKTNTKSSSKPSGQKEAPRHSENIEEEAF